MHVLIATEVYRPGIGGVQVAIDTLVTGLAARGDTVTVMTGAPRRVLAPYTEQEGAVEVIRLPAVKWLANPDNNRLTILSKKWVRRYFARHQLPDVVHIHTPASWTHLTIMKELQKRNIPYIVTNHTLASNLLMNTKQQWFVRWFIRYATEKTLYLMNHASTVTAPTQSALDATPGILVPAVPVSNGVDVEYYTPGDVPKRIYETYGLSTKRHLILYTGRLDGEKRIDILIDAMGQLMRDRDDLQLVVVGKGLLDTQLRQRARPLGDRCIFTGYVSDEDKRSLLRAASVLVMPSPAELQCISALEAMACGVPIVVANQVALPELIDHDNNGYTFEYPSSEDCARRIDTLLKDKKLHETMGVRARKWTIENHSVTHTIDAYRALYQRAIKSIKKF